MALDIGTYTATVQDMDITVINDKDVIRVHLDIEGEACDALIWCHSDKAMGMARTSLKACGLDIEVTPLSVLLENPGYCAGTAVPVVVELWNGKPRASINLRAPVDPAKVAQIEARLKAAKKGGADATGPVLETAPPFPDEEIPF